MSAFPVTPKKLRPFIPLVSPFNRKRSISPPPDIDIGVNRTPLHASSGMFLLIRNILPPTNTGFAKPVELVNQAIKEIISSAAGQHQENMKLLKSYLILLNPLN